VSRILTGTLLLLFVLSVIGPFAWVLITSLKSGSEIFESPWGLPSSPQFINFANAWAKAGIGSYFLNSLIATVGTLAILIPVGAMASYAIARFQFRGSKLIYGSFLGGLMFPQFLTIVPLFILMTQLGLVDTMTGLVLVYVAYSLPFTVFVLTGFFQALPRELAEAATIDGCSDAMTFWKVMLPIAKPGIIVAGIFNAIGLWNEYSLALVLVPSEENRTLPLGIANLAMVQHYQSDWGALFAGLVIVMVPVIAVYWMFRDRVHEAMLAGSIK
jgi:N-acetylglucosamine transport system permease protein